MSAAVPVQARHGPDDDEVTGAGVVRVVQPGRAARTVAPTADKLRIHVATYEWSGGRANCGCPSSSGPARTAAARTCTSLRSTVPFVIRRAPCRQGRYALHVEVLP